MTVNDIICALSNRNDFNYTILEGKEKNYYDFNNYNNIPTKFLDSEIDCFTIGWEDIIFFI